MYMITIVCNRLDIGISVNSHKNNIKALLFLFYRKGNCKMANLSNLQKITLGESEIKFYCFS